MLGVCRGMLSFRIGRHIRFPATDTRDIWNVKDLAENRL